MKNFMLEAVEASKAVEADEQAKEQLRIAEEKRRLEETVFKITGQVVKADDDCMATVGGIQFYLDCTHMLVARVLCPLCGDVVRSRIVRSLAETGDLIRDCEGYGHMAQHSEWHEFHLVEADE